MLDMATGTVRLRVSELLEEHGLSVADLVEKTGMSYTTALALKRNASTRVDFDTLARICYALDVTVDKVLVYEPIQESETA